MIFQSKMSHTQKSYEFGLEQMLLLKKKNIQWHESESIEHLTLYVSVFFFFLFFNGWKKTRKIFVWLVQWNSNKSKALCDLTEGSDKW